MKFHVTDKQQEQIEEWHAAVQKRLLAEGKADSDWLGGNDGENVYYGATGGGLEFKFFPTSIGTVLVVKEAISGEELDVTDYDKW